MRPVTRRLAGGRSASQYERARARPIDHQQGCTQERYPDSGRLGRMHSLVTSVYTRSESLQSTTSDPASSNTREDKKISRQGPAVCGWRCCLCASPAHDAHGASIGLRGHGSPRCLSQMKKRKKEKKERKGQRWTVDAHQQPVEIKQRIFDLRLWLLGRGVGHGSAEYARSVDRIVFLRRRALRLRVSRGVGCGCRQAALDSTDG